MVRAGRPGGPIVVGMTPWSIREVPVPEGIHAARGWLLEGFTDAMNQVLETAWGNRDFERTSRENLGSLRETPYGLKYCLVAVAGDERDSPDPERVLGYAHLVLPLRDNTHRARLDLGVRPALRRHGLGSALYEAALARVREAGRTTVLAVTDQLAEPPEGRGALPARTGQGRVEAGSVDTRFAAARGFALEQVERYSVIDLPFEEDLIARLRRDAEEHAGPDYRLVTWRGSTPPEWIDQYAMLNTRMSTDLPLAGLDFEEDSWDADRVRLSDKQLEERGYERLVLAAEHVPTGTLAAFTVFLAVSHIEEYVHQDNTLVLKEHRGRRLGMLVKTANLQRLAAERPKVRRVGTWNAEENAHMLSINVALGFRPAGGSGIWQLKLN
jgi:GNAT superfamily N-acetyltransferase